MHSETTGSLFCEGQGVGTAPFTMEDCESYNSESSSDGVNQPEGPYRRPSVRSVASRCDASQASHSILEAETKWVNRIKLVVWLVLFVATMVSGIATYLGVRASEYHAFTLQFQDYAQEIADVSHQEAWQLYQSIHALGISLVGLVDAQAQAHQPLAHAPFPYVTVPHFDVHGAHINALAKLAQVTYVPLIRRDPASTAEWQAYVHSTLPPPHNAHVLHAWNDTYTEPLSLDPTETGNAPHLQFAAPIWHQEPAVEDSVNLDVLSHPVVQRVFDGVWHTHQAVVSEQVDVSFLFPTEADSLSAKQPHSLLVEPLYASVPHAETMVGLLIGIIPWDVVLTNILHPNSPPGIVVVWHDSCGDHFTYHVNGPDAVFVATGDWSDASYHHLALMTPFAPFLQVDASHTNANHEHCEYDLGIYPSRAFEDAFRTRNPLLYATTVVALFMGTMLVFGVFDVVVAVRQRRLALTARRTRNLVASLFPSHVRDVLLQDAEDQIARKEAIQTAANASRRGTPLWHDVNDHDAPAPKAPVYSKPIADLFPETTVMFADIVGFTAWSSAREPTLVFVLLETIYHAFDQIAKRRNVFKVETIGDCYVAVTGLPEPRPDHAVAMARFARDCRDQVNVLFHDLERTLGPDTADLGMRFGLHSGPVTAGVLRGDKGRFQLFGDTVNTAARMESNSARNQIHCSTETALLLDAAGKKWTRPREDTIQAKGKGELQTYWLEFGKQSNPSSIEGSTVTSDDMASIEVDDDTWIQANLGLEQPEKVSPSTSALNSKLQRLIDWNTDVMCRFLKVVVTQNGHANNAVDDSMTHESALDPATVEQVHCYIETIASRYRNGAFHNFEHASNMTMSMTKLLSKIQTPMEGRASSSTDLMSDPMIGLACVFAAVIHDVNDTDTVADNAKRSSFDVAWEILLLPKFDGFRGLISAHDATMLERFQQLVKSAVVAATDTSMDITVAQHRASICVVHGTTEQDHALVLDLLMQASNLSHTMQHWHIYHKWSAYQFGEMAAAYTSGEIPHTPAEVWYQQQLDQFDTFVLPMLTLFKSRRVFGESCMDEYILYAQTNRSEWERRGHEVVAQWWHDNSTKPLPSGRSS